MNTEIFPFHSELISRKEKESLMGQHACVCWFTGLSGSGKSTLVKALERRLFEHGFISVVLDGDNLRHGINRDLAFSEADRNENIRRSASLAKLMLDNGIIVLCSFVSPMKQMRQLAAEIIGNDDFLEMYLSTSLDVCEARDVKGLYQKARNGQLPDFTGIHSPYEAPEKPFLQIDTNKATEQECLDEIWQAILPILEKEQNI